MQLYVGFKCPNKPSWDECIQKFSNSVFVTIIPILIANAQCVQFQFIPHKRKWIQV